MRIYLANVGANLSLFKKRRLASPLFADGKFEFLPIPADNPRLDESPNAIRYGDLRSHYDPAQTLTSYIPDRLLDKAVHNSPEFETFTYCDACDIFSRASKLKEVQQGDVLLFVAGLRLWRDGKRTSEYDLHLIGGFRIEEALRCEGAPPDARVEDRFANNAYVISGRETGVWDPIVGNWLFAGSEYGSRRFDKAVPLNKEICEQVFLDASGAPWRWGATKSGRERSPLAVIASYTRAARCFLDTSDSKGAKRADILRDWIAQHTGEADAALLGDGA